MSDDKKNKKKGWWPSLGRNKKSKKKSDQTRVFPHSDNEIDDMKLDCNSAAAGTASQPQSPPQSQPQPQHHTEHNGGHLPLAQSHTDALTQTPSQSPAQTPPQPTSMPMAMNGHGHAHMHHSTQQHSGTSTDSHESGNLKPSNASNDDDEHDHEQDNKSQCEEIEKMVSNMTRILHKLRDMSHTSNTHHSMDVERFQKLIEWVNYSDTHLDILRQAWDDQLFWPFLSTAEAEQRVKFNETETMLVRLSNSIPGAITVTRKAKAKRVRNGRLEDIVKHKRYFPAPQFGKMTLEGSWGQRQVTWDGLLAYLQQEECCICLEELKEHQVLRLNCGHHFHRDCIMQHVQSSTRMNHTPFAVCPLCRNRIEKAELIKEPMMAQYKKIPNLGKKSKSAAALPQSDNNNASKPRVERSHIQRSQSAELTPTLNQNDADEEMISLNFAIMADHEQQRASSSTNQATATNDGGAGHNWGQFGTHLGVMQNDDEYEDEYANLNAVRAMAANAKK